MKSFQAALGSLWLTPRRTLLSGLGMAVGVAAIVMLVSLGKGVERDVRQQVESLGVNLVIVLPGRISPENPFNPMSFIGLSTLRESDLAVVRQIEGVQRVAPIMFVAGGASRGTRWADAALIIGTTPEWFQMRPHRPRRWGDCSLSKNSTPVSASWDPEPARQLFGDEPPLGQTVHLNGVPFSGDRRHGGGESAFPVRWRWVRVRPSTRPIRSLQQAMGSRPDSPRDCPDRTPDREPRQLVERIRAAVRRNHNGSEDFSVLTQEDLLTAFLACCVSSQSP
jgi:hypothetical protein